MWRSTEWRGATAIRGKKGEKRVMIKGDEMEKEQQETEQEGKNIRGGGWKKKGMDEEETQEKA